MDNNPEQNTTPSALDKVAAALAELGEETAAAIAKRAGVGYSTATKRLRALEETDQAEAFRSDDGRTLWRKATNAATSTASDNPPGTTGAGDGPQPDTPARIDDDAHAPERSEDTSTPPEKRVTAVADEAGEATGIPPGPADPPRQPDGSPSEPAATETGNHGGATLATTTAETPLVAELADDAQAPHRPDSAGTTPPSQQAEDPNVSSGGRPRRSKGTLRGAVLDVLEAHPDQPFKTSQLCRAIDKANEGSGSAKASAGAVVNAVHKLVTDGLAVQVAERPAAFQLASRTD